jgi:hypothetical protein
MCIHENGDTRLALDREAGRILGEIFCPNCDATIKSFDQFHFGLTDISAYRCTPNLRGNSEFLGDPDLTC